ncbi:heat-shock protein HtpX [Methanobrevibacter arboriphilus]|jgi:heat shock protein HtpX|uniref:Heat-shock protein HtpX n=1 Tax=Methanobrevibacter arboriphilus TaxID=39441 RepID=A0ACA8R0Z9_METAZ|nr:heat-shock protein HtpX [Methanobrevibacter arboriphilus]GLI12612.1 heat-shock protein HtpX [Methanobrevibacter arboriphilus]
MIVRTWKLKLRLSLAVMLLFGLIFAIVILAATLLGYGGNYTLFVILGLGIIFIQYLIGPSMVEKAMGVKYVTEQQAPELHQMVSELAMNAGISKPKIGVSETNIPNAFAFGRTKKDGRVCVTRGILNTLNKDELKAVLGHELSHIKHNDMAVTTLVSAVPLICYYIALSFLFSGDSRNGGGILIGVLAIAAYFLGQLIVLFISRTREYYADLGSIEIGGKPDKLASALYKLVYGAAKSPKEEVKDIQGVKAFFLNDISNARDDIEQLSQLDLNRDGEISEIELAQLKSKNVNIKTSDKVMELFSTHPNMLKRIERLAEYS